MDRRRRKILCGVITLPGTALAFSAADKGSDLAVSKWGSLPDYLGKENESSVLMGKKYYESKVLSQCEFQEVLSNYYRSIQYCQPGERTVNIVDRLVRDDFRGNVVVNIDGWVLSKTEVALCIRNFLQSA
ncbi:MAG: hypothetical protein KUG75_15585 [Pseudomonadales bacterium]|nr:hypothetical protein [Pseudomonadales bacterium]